LPALSTVELAQCRLHVWWPNPQHLSQRSAGGQRRRNTPSLLHPTPAPDHHRQAGRYSRARRSVFPSLLEEGRLYARVLSLAEILAVIRTAGSNGPPLPGVPRETRRAVYGEFAIIYGSETVKETYMAALNRIPEARHIRIGALFGVLLMLGPLRDGPVHACTVILEDWAPALTLATTRAAKVHDLLV